MKCPHITHRAHADSGRQPRIFIEEPQAHDQQEDRGNKNHLPPGDARLSLEHKSGSARRYGSGKRDRKPDGCKR